MKATGTILIGAILLFFFAGCKNRGTGSMGTSEVPDSLPEEEQLFITYKNTLFCVPSPYEMNSFMGRFKIKPEKEYLNPTENLNNYTSSFKKAINLGIYGADLGYMNISLSSSSTPSYLRAIKKLSDELGIEEMIDSHIYKKLNTSYSNHDTLLSLLSNVYQSSDHFLKDNSREDISVFIIAGGFVETLYILSRHYEKSKKKEILDIVVQQKYPLEFMIKILAPYYKKSDEISVFVDSLVDLAYDFDAIDFNYSYKEPTYISKSNIYTFDNSCTILNAKGSIENITKKVSEIRHSLIQ